MHKQHPQTAYRKYAVLIGIIFENCDKDICNNDPLLFCAPEPNAADAFLFCRPS